MFNEYKRRLFGFDHFFIFDNSQKSDKKSYKLLWRYIKENITTYIVEWIALSKNKQRWLCTKAFAEFEDYDRMISAIENAEHCHSYSDELNWQSRRLAKQNLATQWKDAGLLNTNNQEAKVKWWNDENF